MAKVTCIPEYTHSIPTMPLGASLKKQVRELSLSPSSTTAATPAPQANSPLARDTVAAFLALSDDPKIGSMRTHGDVNHMDAEVALVMVDKLCFWLSLPESQTYLDSHPNVACKLKQKFATISPPSCPSGEDPIPLTWYS